MSTNVLMPQLGESIAEGTVVRWIKRVGDRVHRDEPLFEISTDKVDAEVPSPAAGVLADVRVQVGETVPVESIVAVIADGGDDLAAADSVPAESASTRSSAADVPAGTLGPTGPRVGRPVSPVVRKLAREHGIDVATVTGTGGGGRVTKADLLKHAGVERVSSGPVVASGDGAEADARTRVEEMSVMRRQIAGRMVLSRRTAAHVHTVFDVDFSRVRALKDCHRAGHEREGVQLTYLSFIAKAVTAAIADVPVINASLSDDGTRIIHNADVNLGIAVALDQGLIVPVIRKANHKSLADISRTIADLAARARSKILAPDEVQGGTFTITNPGAFGSIFGLPIINQPQVAILCVGAVERRPVVVDDADTIQAQWRAYLALGFDHRLIDGAVADRFMMAVKTKLESFDADLL